VPTPTHALLLTAGLGTRLHPLTTVRAKPAVPVAGEPLARHIIQSLVSSGVTDVTLNLHHLPQTLTRVVGDGSDLGARIHYSWEHPVVLGSAGGPRQALDIVAADSFFLVNGDTLTDAPLEQLWRAHAGTDALVTLALVPNHAPLRYGGVRLSDDGVVTDVVARGADAVGSCHFIGLQIASRQAFLDLPSGRPANSIGEHYAHLMAARRGSIRGVLLQADFWDIGTVTDYWQTSRALSAGVPIPPGRDCDVARSASVTGSILWDAVTIGDDAVVDECIVTDGVSIPPGATFRRAVLTQPAGGAITATPFLTD
jgi:NDP-sugar pyrophosphorylase family protein